MIEGKEKVSEEVRVSKARVSDSEARETDFMTSVRLVR